MGKSEAYKARRRTARLKRNVTKGAYVQRMHQARFNRQTKQDRRWIRAKVESKDRGGISVEAEEALIQHTHKPEHKYKRLPRVYGSEGSEQTRAAVRHLLTRLWFEREAAMTAQRQKYEAIDWWVHEKREDHERQKEKQRRIIGAFSVEMDAINAQVEIVLAEKRSAKTRVREEAEEEEEDEEEDPEEEAEEEADKQFGGSEPPEPIPRDGEEDEEDNEERWA